MNVNIGHLFYFTSSIVSPELKGLSEKLVVNLQVTKAPRQLKNLFFIEVLRTYNVNGDALIILIIFQEIFLALYLLVNSTI